MYALIYAAFKLLYLPNVPTVSEIILKLEHITITFTIKICNMQLQGGPKK